ncbi:unnamed protein product [Prorocentrum cordatum]|uniref:Alpha-1,4-N-acetylglucosaminyltransferase n=1 Tax=Prorocentrum cordatum TaxID=2364126 RepID=A0ABN9TDE4_9DINO|nr:unnamed protein product [Polarella glacialis]|mmetsp:Transcript_32978/g.94252  ORF Transcript_32978/g.94252 Transcript_32978/m.94252 type:complete len:317 (+) Transcript_32978:92-1042(+)
MKNAVFALLMLLKRVASFQHSFDGTALRQEESGGYEGRIPFQLIMTAKQGSIDELPPEVRENVRKTLNLNPELRVRFLNDSDCSDFIASNFGSDLHSAYINEKYGAYRGDICRAAVVALEGGFYADLDMQFRVPFSEMVDDSTTFMSSFSKDCEILNAIFAAERGSKVMQRVLEEIKGWYNGSEPTNGLMGIVTMMHGLQKVVQEECPGVNVKKESSSGAEVQCGPHQNFLLYREQHFKCQLGMGNDRRYLEAHPECTPARVANNFLGAHYGIFRPTKGKVRGPLLAWSRFDNCTVWGCEQSGRREAAPLPVICTV